MNRYSIRPHPVSSHVSTIYDRVPNSQGAQVHVFGGGYRHDGGYGHHRIRYTYDDAQAVVDWLNDRVQGYAFRSHITVLP